MQWNYRDHLSICWACANATGGCTWADELKPVDGWKAKPTIKDNQDTFQVLDCPEYVQDCLDFGLRRQK